MTKIGNFKLPKVRNKNTVIFHLELVKHLLFSKICTSLYDQHKQSILSIYRLTDPEYLKVVFLDTATHDQYLKKGLQIQDFKLSGYDNSQFRDFLMINLNSVPIMNIETLNKRIASAMYHFVPKGARLHSFYALVVPDTTFLTNQWQAHFDVTNCRYEVFDDLQKFVEIDGFKVNLYWRKATKNCFFCDKEGHIKKDCEEWKLLKTNKEKQATTVDPNILLEVNKGKQTITVDPITISQSEDNSNSNEYFMETQGASADNLSDETETPD